MLAPVGGIIEWLPNTLGSYVTQGQPLGSINPAIQKNIEIAVNTTDWINLSIGDPATFVDGRDYKVYSGKVIATPSEPTMNNGVSQFSVSVELETALPTGTNGQVSINGAKTLLFVWLARKPIAKLKAWWTLHLGGVW